MRDQKGAALAMVLVLLVLGGLILAPLLGLMSTGLLAGQVYEKKTSEYYAADGGVEDAIWKIVNGVAELPDSPCGNQSWSYDYQLVDDINDKDVEVTIEYLGDYTHLITATAASDDGSSTTVKASATLDVAITEGEGFFDSDWDVIEEGEGNYYLEAGAYDPNDIQVADGNIELGDGATLDGNAWAMDGNIVLKPGATITGSVLCQGTSGHTVELGEGAIIGGTVCAQQIILKKGAQIWGTAYAECVDSGTIVTLEENAFIQGDAYSENGDIEVLKSGAMIVGDAYAANEVKVGGGGLVIGSIYSGYEDWPGCPLCGGGSVASINGVSIGYWQIE